MKRVYQRPNFVHYILFLCCVVQAVQLTIAGCSHTKPYYHPDVPESAKHDENITGNLQYRLLLLGDGGEPKPDEPVLKTLEAWARKASAKTSVVFLGDNMYPEGMTARKQHEATARLLPQIAVIQDSGAHGFFMPGNHDWASGGAEGYSAVLAQETFINDRLSGGLRFLPPGGSPGPVALELPADNPVVRLVVIDTQWWLHAHEKPEKSRETVIAELTTLLDTTLPVVVLGHHPLESYGPHGGQFDWRSHLFPARLAKKWLWIPVPIVGSLYPYGRWYVYRSEQDMSGDKNREMVAALNRAIAGRELPPQGSPLLIYVSGHEHSLQVLKGDVTDYLLVSGSAASRKVTEVMSGESTLFAHEHTGFMGIDFLEDGRVLLRVVEPDGKGVVFHRWLIGRDTN